MGYPQLVVIVDQFLCYGPTQLLLKRVTVVLGFGYETGKGATQSAANVNNQLKKLDCLIAISTKMQNITPLKILIIILPNI